MKEYTIHLLRFALALLANVGFALSVNLLLLILAGCAAPAAPTTTAPTPIPATSVPPAPTVAPIAGTNQTLELVWTVTGDPNPLGAPVGVTVDGDRNVYVVDAGYDRVQKFDRNGKFVTMWGTRGQGDGQFDFGDGAVIGIDAESNLYVGDTGNYRVQKFDRNGKFLGKWGSQGSGEGQFSYIGSIKIDRENNVYVLDTDNQNVQIFDRNGKFLSRWGEDGLAEGKLHKASSLALDGQGNVWIAGVGTPPPAPLQKFDRSGKLLQGLNPGPLDSYLINFYEIAWDNKDKIYVSDQGNRRIVKLDGNGNWIAAWGSYGSGTGQFNQMESIFVDPDGYIYVADRRNNNVQKFRQPDFGR